MPASGKKDVMSGAELKQRSEASRTHGAFAFRDRGEVALSPSNRSRFAELSGIIQTRPGVIGLLQERCVQSVLMCEILESYIIAQKQGDEEHEGKELDAIPALKVLPAYQNSAQRCIKTLLDHMKKDDPNALDAGRVLEAVKRGQKNAGEQADSV